MRCIALFTIVLGLAPAAVYGAHPLITEDTGTQGKGNWQLEVNGERTRDSADSVVTRGFQPAATLSYGIVDNLDLQLTQSYLWQRTEGTTSSGRLDFSIDVKWRFFENGALSLGLKPGVTLPGGREEEDFGTGRVTWGSLVILSYEPEGWAFHSHVGYRRNRNNLGQRESLKHVSAALWWKPTERMKLILDHSLDTNPDPAAERTLRQTIVGIIYSVTPKFDLDAGVRRGNDPATDRALLVGTTLRW